MSDTQVRAYQGGTTKALGDRQVRVVVSTPRVDRHGDVVELSGIDLTEYRRNPVVLENHDHERRVARCVEIGVKDGALEALVQFPPEGTSEHADRVYREISAGLLSAASIGFIPKKWSYLDDKSPWNGRRYAASEMIEFSFVGVGANPDALLIERTIHRAVREVLAEGRAPEPEPEPEPEASAEDVGQMDPRGSDDEDSGQIDRDAEIRALEIRSLEIAAG